MPEECTPKGLALLSPEVISPNWMAWAEVQNLFMNSMKAGVLPPHFHLLQPTIPACDPMDGRGPECLVQGDR